jgi:SAM-dependent methyltransferase
VGPDGRVIAVDASPSYGARVRGLAGVEFRCASLEDVELQDESVDVVYARWVFSFLADPAMVVRRLARVLRPGGILAIQDYNHDGLSLFPRSVGFEAAARATRAFYADSGGDLWIGARLPRLCAEAGLQQIDEHAHLLCGGPDSAAFRWVGEFMPRFVPVYVENGLMTPQEGMTFEAEWALRSADPYARIFTPTVVDYAARKPR